MVQFIDENEKWLKPLLAIIQKTVTLILAVVCPNLFYLATANALVRLHLDNTFHLHSNGDENSFAMRPWFHQY